MLGWEFPPLVTGGLGVACYGLTKALNGMGVDVMFVLPRPAESKPKNGDASQHPQWHKQIRTVVQTRQIKAAATDDVHRAVERATHHAAQSDATDRDSTEPKATPPAILSAGAMPTSPQEEFTRVTFVPIDTWLQPYMTAPQYQRMVVEKIVSHHPIARWERQFEETGNRWVERALDAGSGPTKQPPNQPQAPRAIDPIEHHANPPFAQPAKRSYIDEPDAVPHLQGPANTQYAGDLFSETERYARLAMAVARGEDFAVVHGHDWMTFEAAMAVSEASGKPLVLQIHSTELDRAGHNANPRIMEIERQGMNAASRVIAVSYKTKTQLIEKYGIDPQKIEVVYNATETPTSAGGTAKPPLRKKQKTVLFLGRLTEQKGPDYFLRAAQKVLSLEPDVKFVVAGKGDLLDDLKELAAELGIKKKVVFTGFLKKDPLEKTFKSADVYVMPSLSEPFGIAPLEALAHDVPVIISKQSGVAEVLHHVLKVDFWDTEDLANKILAVLRHPPLAQTLRERGQQEVRQLSWDDSARRIVELYELLSAAPVS